MSIKCAHFPFWTLATVYRLLAGSFMIVSLPAVEEYLVPDTSLPVQAEFPGFVEADRGRLQTITPQAEKLIITWCGENGRAVVPGDRIAVFDPAVVERDLPQKMAEADGAEAQYILDLLRLDKTQIGLEDQQRDARSQLATIRAQLAALGSDAVGKIALARARADLAATNVGTLSRAAQRLQVQAAAGDATAQAVAAADHAVVTATFNRERAEAEWKIAENQDRTIERERLHLQEVTLMGKLGWQRDAQGVDQEDPTRGFPGRLTEIKARRSSQELSLAADRDARTKSAREALRDSHDHTPLSWISLRPVGSPVESATRWEFSPGDVPALPALPTFTPATTLGIGQRVDHGEPFALERGFGWDRDLSLRLRSGAGHSWILVREQAQWRCVVPDGRYLVTFGLGAESDWDGALIRVSGSDVTKAESSKKWQVGFVSNRIAGGSWPTADIEVTVSGGSLLVMVGDDVPKTLRVTTAGILLLHQSTRRGKKTEWLQRPVAYIAEPSALRINGRIPQELAPLLTASAPQPPAAITAKVAKAAPAAVDSDPRGAIATQVVQVVPPGMRPDEVPLSGTVTTVGTKPVGTAINEQGWNEQDPGSPQDLGSREVGVMLSPVDALRLRVRTTVRVRLTCQPTEGIYALPPWYVVARDSRSWVRERVRGYLEVPAQRAGSVTLVRGLTAGMRLLVPDSPPSTPVVTEKPVNTAGVDQLGYPGEVVTGVRTKITMGSSWGRVATFIPDGTEVSVGDDILTLYNPWIDQQQDNIKRERQNANRAFQEATAARRERLLAAGEQRREDLVAEGNARLDVAQARRSDPQFPVTVIDHALANAAKQHTATVAAATASLANPGVATLADAQAAAQRATVEATRSELERAHRARAGDWLSVVSSAGMWGEALAVLGQRERKAELIRAEDRAAVMKSRAALDQMLQGQDWVVQFEKNKILRASVAGRLYWLLAWNDQTRSMGKVTKDVILWGGVPVAEIVDLSRLAFAAEVPEPRYPHLKVGDAVTVRIPGLGDLRLMAAISRIGQALSQSRDAKTAGEDAPVTDQRVFTVTVDVTLPPEHRGRLMPGMRGFLELTHESSSKTTATQP